EVSISPLFRWPNSVNHFIALCVRRLHDTDRSGAWALLYLVPIIGWLVLFVFACLEGNSGSNRYGNDPKFGSN
ncbi:DUF805 domain-containing protein, partial [Escherichia coli]|nr:DUF805 domain-containing protein [Escherichia coli]